MKLALIVFSFSILAQAHRGHDHTRHAAEAVAQNLSGGVGTAATCEPTPVPSNLDKESQLLAERKWYGGAPDCSKPGAKKPPFEVHQVNEGYFVIRQNKCVNFEAPFIYLYIGDTGALLLDTGASDDPAEFPLREFVDKILKSRPNGDKLKLTVAHSHSHGDHMAGDNQFTNRPNTTVVGGEPEEVAKAFGVKDWPNGTGQIDLGNRKLDIIPIPGHEASSIAVYDQQSKDLVTGDTLYPGNIFLSPNNWGEFRSSVKRLHEFSQKNTVRNILGAHIEMSSTPKQDYPYQSTYHPHEHRLPLYQKHLDELYEYTEKNSEGKAKVFDDFTIPLD